jgi:hypothetical protein
VLADYTALGVIGIGAANQPTVAMINSALATHWLDLYNGLL